MKNDKLLAILDWMLRIFTLSSMGGITLLFGFPFAIYAFSKHFDFNFTWLDVMHLFYVLLFAFYLSSYHIKLMMDDTKLNDLSDLHHSGPWGKFKSGLILYTILFSVYSFANGMWSFIIFMVVLYPHHYAKLGLASIWQLYGNMEIISILAMLIRAFKGWDKVYFRIPPKRQ